MHADLGAKLGRTRLCGAGGGLAAVLVEVWNAAKKELPWLGLGAGAGAGAAASGSCPSYVGWGEGEAFHAPLAGPPPRAPHPADAI